ncbi:unnamed protein product, partial [Ectocarpus fasciculatus]
MGAWAAVVVGLAVRAAIFFGDKPVHFSSNARDCFYWDDIRLMTGVIVCVSVPAINLVWGLSRVDDVFKINEELTTVIVVIVCIE